MDPYLAELDRAMRDANRRQVSDVVNGPGGEPMRCSDCGHAFWEGGSSSPTTQKVFCDPCYRWRDHRLLQFDPRSRQQLEAAERAA